MPINQRNDNTVTIHLGEGDVGVSPYIHPEDGAGHLVFMRVPARGIGERGEYMVAGESPVVELDSKDCPVELRVTNVKSIDVLIRNLMVLRHNMTFSSKSKRKDDEVG
jgi:hypothetical protein